MISNEVFPMAVKKSTAPKGGGMKKAKAAVKKAAPKAAPKAAMKKAAPKAAAKKAPKAGAKKAAPKKAAAVKLTDNQVKLLADVAATKLVGLLGTKGTAKGLAALQGKKLIKKVGKQEGGHSRYQITKLGEKHSPASGPATDTSSTPPA